MQRARKNVADDADRAQLDEAIAALHDQEVRRRRNRRIIEGIK